MSNFCDKSNITKERIVQHCAWIATFDRAYAIATFNRYAEMLPWLELKKK